MRVGIVGAGILGRTVAFWLLQKGYKVSMFDRQGLFERSNASYAAAGMLAPLSESLRRDASLATMGVASLKILKDFVRQHDFKTQINTIGTLFAASANQHNLVDDAYRSLQRMGFGNYVRPMEKYRFLVTEESCIDPTFYLDELAQKSLDRGLHFFQQEVSASDDCGFLTDEAGKHESFDWVIDTRGMGALSQDRSLRPVRGETILLYAPRLALHAMLRVQDIHQGFYVVPQGDHKFILGASELESSGTGPTVDSMLHLLETAFRFSPALREAEIISFKSGVRAAYPNNFPRIVCSNRKIYINGMYRHGFLLSPLIAQGVLGFMGEGVWSHWLTELIFSSSKESGLAKSDFKRQRNIPW